MISVEEDGSIGDGDDIKLTKVAFILVDVFPGIIGVIVTDERSIVNEGKEVLTDVGYDLEEDGRGTIMHNI